MGKSAERKAHTTRCCPLKKMMIDGGSRCWLHVRSAFSVAATAAATDEDNGDEVVIAADQESLRRLILCSLSAHQPHLEDIIDWLWNDVDGQQQHQQQLNAIDMPASSIARYTVADAAGASPMAVNGIDTHSNHCFSASVMSHIGSRCLCLWFYNNYCISGFITAKESVNKFGF